MEGASIQAPPLLSLSANPNILSNGRRSLTPALSLVVNVNDIFDSQKIETITETDRLRQTSIRRNNGRTFSVGLAYRFGSFGGAGQRQGRPGGGGPGMRGAGGGMGPGGPGH